MLWIVLRCIPVGIATALATAAVAECIDINSASQLDLMRIVHIDKVRSVEAIELRERRPFADVRDLTRVKGIGPSRVLDIEAQGLACVGSEAPAGARPAITGGARVVDGDSIVIADEQIRLIGIDAPEVGQTCRVASQDSPCAQDASVALAEIIGTTTVRCEVYGRDRYQRALGVCYAGDVELNRAMVQAGHALAWYPEEGVVLGPSYDVEQATAQQARAGIWQSDFIAPSEWRRTHTR
jgi:endonuclease YncB( thermonuclease family)